MTGLLTFDHQWLLEPIDDGTRVIQHEVDKELFMWFWNSDWIIPAYTRTSEALREAVLTQSVRARCPSCHHVRAVFEIRY